MGISVEKMQVATCDNPECGRRVTAYIDEVLPGVTGRLQVDAPWGGYPLAFFSCEVAPEHVAKALVGCMASATND